MAEGTYEYECMRAELLGIDKPSEEEFEKMRADRLQQEQASHEEAEAQELEDNEESMQNTGGKLDELNSILSSTQQKLNRFKSQACTSLSNIFNRGSMDLGSEGPTTSATASRRNTTAVVSTVAGEDAKLDEALANVDELQQEGDAVGPRIPTEKIRAAKMDINKKMTSQLDTLDQLINKAEKAEMSMTEQNKQLRKMAK